MTESMVNTVVGQISPDELGMTLVHEHIVFGFPGWYGDTVAQYDRAAVVDAAVQRMADLRKLGVTSYVDATLNDTGRDPMLYREISERSGMQIVCTTGFFNESQGASAYFNFRRGPADPVEEIYGLFMQELTDGIPGTGVKAGVIKVATGKNEITDYERMFFAAAARAQRETGVPIITHTEDSTMGPEQAELLIAGGADPDRIMIGHMGDTVDLSYQLATLERGVSVAFDRMGMEALPDTASDEQRVARLVELIGMGFADRLMLSHDSIGHWLGREVVFPDQILTLMANWHPAHISRHIIPALLEGGATRDQVMTIIEGNPRRLFGG